MKAKGSVTIFLSLALLLVIALVGSLLESARVTVAGRLHWMILILQFRIF